MIVDMNFSLYTEVQSNLQKHYLRVGLIKYSYAYSKSVDKSQEALMVLPIRFYYEFLFKFPLSDSTLLIEVFNFLRCL